jgi:hypothetical protein
MTGVFSENKLKMPVFIDFQRGFIEKQIDW